MYLFRPSVYDSFLGTWDLVLVKYRVEGVIDTEEFGEERRDPKSKDIGLTPDSRILWFLGKGPISDVTTLCGYECT